MNKPNNILAGQFLLTVLEWKHQQEPGSPPPEKK
jgi:hypothetical protein